MAIPGIASNINGTSSLYTTAFTVNDVSPGNVIPERLVPMDPSETAGYDGYFPFHDLGNHDLSIKNMDGSDGGNNIDEVINRLNKTLHVQNGSDTVHSTYEAMVNNYNRFKVALPNTMLRAGFAHLFFVKPSCNIWKDSSKTILADGLSSNELFAYAYKGTTGRRMLAELSATDSRQFMMSLSNAAISFSPQDEYIQDDTYGRGYTGYKIAYGKRNVESRTAGSFEIEYQDDRDLHIYQTHKLWEEYINGVYSGEFAPDINNIRNKILDYVGALYYIVVAEDGETIIFWTKYYGVFPVTAPSSQLAWTSGNVLDGASTKLNISYRYSMKADFDPYCITEFNRNASMQKEGASILTSSMALSSSGTSQTKDSLRQQQMAAANNGSLYQPSYDVDLGHVGPTWVGTPFIEERITNNEIRYILRFRPV